MDKLKESYSQSLQDDVYSALSSVANAHCRDRLSAFDFDEACDYFIDKYFNHEYTDESLLGEGMLDENKIELARVSDYGLNHFDIYGIIDILKNAKSKKAQFISLILRSMDFEARMLTDAGRDEHIIKVQRWYNIAMFPSTHNSQTKQDIANGLRGDFTFQPPKGRAPHDKANDMLKALGLHASALLNKNGDEQIQFETKREKDIDPVTNQDTGRGASKVETHYYSIDSSNQIIREYTPQELIDNGFVKDAFGKKYGSGYNSTTRTFFVAGIIDILEN